MVAMNMRSTSGSGGFQASIASLAMTQCSAPTASIASTSRWGLVRWCMGIQPMKTCSIMPPLATTASWSSMEAPTEPLSGWVSR